MAYKQKLTFGVIVGTRNIFNFKLAQEGRAHILSKLEKMGYETVILPAGDTPTGAVETLQDALPMTLTEWTEVVSDMNKKTG